MHPLLDRVLDSGYLLTGVGVIVIVAIRSAVQVVTSCARERTRREIAAFIAEGSITPEQGERLMKAGGGSC